MRHDELPTGEFYEDFKFFYDYYGSVDYSDKIVQAAFEQTSVTLNKVTLDFSTLDFPARERTLLPPMFYFLSDFCMPQSHTFMFCCVSSSLYRNHQERICVHGRRNVCHSRVGGRH